MATQDRSQEPGTPAKNTGAPRPSTHPRPSATHVEKYGNDAIKPAEEQEDGAGMPPGYKPDTSVTFHPGKKGEPDTIKGADGKTTAVSPMAGSRGNAMETLPEKHTYYDRVCAQAKSLGIDVDPAWTLEYLLDVIRWKASS